MKDHYVLKSLSEIYGLAWLYDMRESEDRRIFPEQPAWLLQSLFIDRKLRGRHYGSMLLEKVCRNADREHVTLYLQISPDRDCPLTEEQVRAFYSRHGFINHVKSWPTVMMRSPRKETS